MIMDDLLNLGGLTNALRKAEQGKYIKWVLRHGHNGCEGMAIECEGMGIGCVHSKSHSKAVKQLPPTPIGEGFGRVAMAMTVSLFVVGCLYPGWWVKLRRNKHFAKSKLIKFRAG